jgi:CMP-N-acetylneuraminic acid synthetase
MADGQSKECKMKTNILGIIPARGGSKGVPKKNIIPLLGKPLIQYTIEESLKSKKLDKVIVSTDDEEIAEISKSLKAEVPFIRPAELATDTAIAVDVIKHAILKMEDLDKKRYHIVVMLQPTSPLRTSRDIDNAIGLLKGEVDSAVSVVDVGEHHPLRMHRLVNDGWLINYIHQGKRDTRPRQELPPVYLRNGAIYIARRNVIFSGDVVGKNCKAYIMPPEKSINIDTKLDLILAEYLLKKAVIKNTDD